MKKGVSLTRHVVCFDDDCIWGVIADACEHPEFDNEFYKSEGKWSDLIFHKPGEFYTPCPLYRKLLTEMIYPGATDEQREKTIQAIQRCDTSRRTKSIFNGEFTD